MEVQHFKSRVMEASRDASRLQQEVERAVDDRMEEQFIDQAQKQEHIRPLTEQLGSERIL